MPTHPLRRLAPASAGLVLLATALTACGGGGGSDAPTSASQQEFCDAYNAEPGGGDDVSADQVHDYASKLADVGTPDSVTGDAREGFEVYVDYLADISDDDIKKLQESDDPGDIVSGDDKAKVEAFFKSDALIQCVTDSVSTDLPDLPTDIPS